MCFIRSMLNGTPNLYSLQQQFPKVDTGTVL
ncbi:protein of unknown function [Candidatus Nitrospira inopinata]|uniref:Uncharacterized protein n=1 Tax=Candidatus Nitrospira inopinata TaxID=1715989 RepID=A0A0S4KNA0_9BACT|nr:protein of unknown function [Candidatus Nitrospira inopinata]